AIVSNQTPTAYFQLDNSLTNSLDTNVVLEVFGAGAFTADIFRNIRKSYAFVNQTDYLQNTTTNLISGGGTSNTTSTASGSITLLFKTLDPGTNTGQRFLFSAG